MRRLLCWIGVHRRPRLHFVEAGSLVDVVMDCSACRRVLASDQYDMAEWEQRVAQRAPVDAQANRQAWGRPQ